MQVKRLFKVRPYLLLLMLLCVGRGFNEKALAQTTTDALLGAWSGRLHYGDESKPYAVRFEIDKKNRLVMFYDSPEMKFHNFGPFSLKQEGTKPLCTESA